MMLNADHIVAGGQPSDMTPTDNIIKECGEEASMPLELARTAKPVGAVSYTTSALICSASDEWLALSERFHN